MSPRVCVIGLLALPLRQLPLMVRDTFNTRAPTRVRGHLSGVGLVEVRRLLVEPRCVIVEGGSVPKLFVLSLQMLER